MTACDLVIHIDFSEEPACLLLRDDTDAIIVCLTKCIETRIP